MYLYNDLSILLYNWEQLNITSDWTWLLIDKTKDKKVKLADVEQAYFDLHDKYSEVTGSTDRMEKIRALYIARMEARYKYAEGDKAQKNFIGHYEAQLKSMIEETSDVDIIKGRMAVQKLYGMHINPKETTLLEYLKITEIALESRSKQRTHGED